MKRPTLVGWSPGPGRPMIPMTDATHGTAPQCTSESIFGERCVLSTGHEGRHRASIHKTFADAVQLDELGRVVRTPAIEKLVAAARAVDFAFWNGSPDDAEYHALHVALREVDAEASHMGQTRPDSRETVPLPNKEVATSVEGGVQTRNPAITRGPGAESDWRPLSSADLERTDRQCKK